MKLPLLRILTVVAALAGLPMAFGQDHRYGDHYRDHDRNREVPHHISFRVIATHRERRPAPEYCGYRRDVPNFGIFIRETREYSEFADGLVIRTWVEPEFVFDRCW